MNLRATTLRAATALGVLGVILLTGGTAAASGGGGCGQPMTDGHGTTVTIEDFCFTPTILSTRVGESVTWTNADLEPHNVIGSNGLWGSFELIEPNKSTAFTFTKPGVFPYACTVHSGMTGAVVVRLGLGGRGVGISPVSLTSASDEPAPPASDAGAGPWPVLALAAFGIYAAGVAIGRRQRAREKAQA